MSVFSRRVIQKNLDSLSGIVGKKKLGRIARTLNIEGNKKNDKKLIESLAAAWEVLIVSAFAELGNTKYEKKISNGKRPDFFFSDSGVSLIGDVVTVSDDQQHRKNPVNEFRAIIGRLWKELGPKKGSISLSVGGIDIQAPRAPRAPGPQWLSLTSYPISRPYVTRLSLPPSSQLSQYLNEKVSPFLKELSEFPDRPNCLIINEQYDPETIVRFSIAYDPSGSRFWAGTHPDYTTITDIERHVLWRRLFEKSGQFAFAAEEFPRILFVCDGGCEGLRDSLSGGSQYHVKDVIDHFWRRTEIAEDGKLSRINEQGISAVIIISIENSIDSTHSAHKRDFILKPRLYVNPHCQFPLNKACKEVLSKVVSILPDPLESPTNALYLMRENPFSTRNLGVFTVKEHGIEMSGIELLKILSGELTIEQFCRNYHLPSNPFKNALMRFQTIKSVKVSSAGNRDDDRIFIEFGPQDAAIGPFRVPETKKGQEDVS